MLDAGGTSNAAVMHMQRELTLFALRASRALGERIAASLEVDLAAHEEREFADGEHKTRPLVEVRGRDAYVIQTLSRDQEQSPNDKLCRLLFFIGALKDAGAERVTAVTPYLCYARKDRRSKARDPVTTRYVARMFEAVGTDRVVTIDVHNIAAFENAFGARTRPENLTARSLFVEYFRKLDWGDLAVVSPDVGGVKRAEPFRRALAQRLGRPVSGGYVIKARSEGKLTFGAIAGDVEKKHIIIVDDLVSSGGTLLHAARACRGNGALSVHAAVTHGAFVPGEDQVLEDPALDELVVTDTILPLVLHSEAARRKVKVLETARFFAEAIRRLHDDGSIVELMDV
jgi:ribose-phosphate pyrophosphokinase